MATLKGENARGADDAMAQYQEHLDGIMQRQMARFEEGRARDQAVLPEPNEETEAILRHFQTTPYRTKDRETPE